MPPAAANLSLFHKDAITALLQCHLMSQEFSSANIWKALSCGWDFKGGAVTSAGLNCPSLTVASGHLNLPWYGWRQHGHYLPPWRTSHPQMAAGACFSVYVANQSAKAPQNTNVNS